MPKFLTHLIVKLVKLENIESGWCIKNSVLLSSCWNPFSISSYIYFLLEVDVYSAKKKPLCFSMWNKYVLCSPFHKGLNISGTI